MSDLNRLSATELRKGIDDGSFTAADVSADSIQRITEREPEIHAWRYFDPQGVSETVDVNSPVSTHGLLSGIPVGIKDIMDTDDMTTEYGSGIFKGNQPGSDASVVASLRDAGATIFGKTVTTEFAYFQPGPTVNPVDPRCTPGGSSSGSAAAVADYMVPVAFGSQTAGSLTRPASYCGIVGFKPSFGVHSLVGVKALSPSLDTLGWLTRSVEDSALVRAALLGESFNGLEPGLTESPRIGVCRTAEWFSAGEDTVNAIEYTVRSLEQAGCVICEIELPKEFEVMVAAQKTIMAFEAARSLAWEWSRYRAQLSESISSLIADGLGCSFDEYAAARLLASSCRGVMDSTFGQQDVLLTASAPGEAPEGLSDTGDPIFSRLWTLLHLPSISLPGFEGINGRPVGIQLVGRAFNDENLLRIAQWVHREIRN